MRMIPLIALLIATPALAASGQQKEAAPDVGKCLNDRVQHVGNERSARVRKLDELPAGDLSLTVLREVDGCRSATVVGYGYGRADRKEAARSKLRAQLRN